MHIWTYYNTLGRRVVVLHIAKKQLDAFRLVTSVLEKNTLFFESNEYAFCSINRGHVSSRQPYCVY